MSPSDLRHYPSISKLFYLALLLQYVITLPIPSNKTFYHKSIESLVANKCKMPEEITLPFPNTSDSTPFSYLLIPLQECQKLKFVSEIDEDLLLCKEIFEVLKNITCSDYNTTLPKIESSRVSKDVCNEFKDMKGVLPKQNEYLSGRLVDDMICNLLCKEKFESLCRTLVWSYDVQAQIQNASNPVDENVDANNVESDGGAAGADINPKYAQQEPILGEANNVRDDDETANMLNSDKTIMNSDINNLESIPPTSKNPVSPTPATKLDSPVSVNQSPETLDQISKTTKPAQTLNIAGKNTAVSQQNIQPEKPHVGVQDNGPLDLNQITSGNSANPEEKGVKNQPKDLEPVDVHKIDDQTSNLIPGVADENSNPNKKVSVSTTPEVTKNKSSTSANNVQTSSTNLDNPIPPNVPGENDLSNVDVQGEENKSGLNGKPSDMQTSSASDKKKIDEKNKETDSAPNKVISDSESTTFLISAGNSADEEQDDKEAEQYYNDTENNEADYPKSEYESTANEVVKPKKTESKSSVVSEVASVNDFPSNYGFVNNRNNIGRAPDEIQMIPSFPEQEDSHFFFYFLSIVLILMAGYLIFHNKQKIIALIVEGRHERRRRSHGAGYKKLETK